MVAYQLTKLTLLLMYPLTQSLLVIVVSLTLVLLGARRTGYFLLFGAFVWLYVCSTSVFADWLMSTLEDDYPPKALSVLAESEAIVVLGGATRGDTHMSTLGDLNQQADRLSHAVGLFRARKAPIILLSGGSSDPSARPEAQIMRDHLLNMGVPEQAILMERNSRNTYENAMYTAMLLEKDGIDRILLVTSAFHMRRAERLFTLRGLTVVPAPTDYQRLISQPVVSGWLPTAEDLLRSTYAIREHVAYWAYVMQGRM